MYSNRSGVSLPTCTCARKGTYGLLVSKPPSETSGVLVFGVSRPVVYGCLISLILSILTWVLLLKTYFNISNKLITGLKVYYFLCIDYNSYQVHTQDLFYLSSLKFKFSGIKKYIYVKLGWKLGLFTLRSNNVFHFFFINTRFSADPALVKRTKQ